jgi:tRNA A-37 threonylcarbamoyl transferase component Bud32
MSEPQRCPECGAEIPANMPAGLCPQCLLKAGMQPESQIKTGPETAAAPKAGGFVPPTPEELGKLVPQFEILELLAKGGMGAVYKARQKSLDRIVAIKILPPDISNDTAFADRFTREARALAKLSHPNIVGVHDFGESGGLFYFVMDFVDGANLRQLLLQKAFTPKDALAIVPQVCDALQFAHDEGVVHRDIKPENILIDKKGRVKIADFGLAKLLGQDPTIDNLTATNQVMGTIRYMSPEQMEGAKDIDHRADIYSLGVVFYELLTGELPLGRFAPPSKKVQIDVRLDEIVLRALEKEPNQRYQHAGDVKTEVESVVRTPREARSRRASSDDAKRFFASLREWIVEMAQALWTVLSFQRLTADHGAYARWVGAPLLGFTGFCLLVVMANLIGARHPRDDVIFNAILVVPVVVLLAFAALSVPWFLRRKLVRPEAPAAPWTPEQIANRLRVYQGLLNATGIITFFGWLLMAPFVHEFGMTVLWAMIAGTIICLGARDLKKERDPGYIAPILAMAPFSPAVILGLPVGVRLLRTLARPEVQAYFEAKRHEKTASAAPA